MTSSIRIILSALFLLQFLCAGGAWGLGITQCPVTVAQAPVSGCHSETAAAPSLKQAQPTCCCDSGIQPCRVKRDKPVATSPSILPAQPRVLALYRAPSGVEPVQSRGYGKSPAPSLQEPIPEDPIYMLTQAFLI